MEESSLPRDQFPKRYFLWKLTTVSLDQARTLIIQRESPEDLLEERLAKSDSDLSTVLWVATWLAQLEFQVFAAELLGSNQPKEGSVLKEFQSHFRDKIGMKSFPIREELSKER